ncbi:thymidylate kinase [Arthrobacter agilis]|uniref:thymidylate kinase n=1 Tax=Arthrobacter agilis TaxID=37921 RepID=UPI00236555BE|nr:thymidylate kinase [Arthrobacter agilis]WDF32811.1 thymidylate kinase [Arthrobacter agilis]
MKGTPLRILLIGIDGSGKSTAARKLEQAVAARGRAARVFRNPAGRRTMAGWWAVLSWTPGPRVLDALETSARVANMLVNQMRLRSFDGVAVLDRGLECQLALRAARGLPRGVVLPWLLRALPAPDVVVFVDVPVGLALERVGTRATDHEDPAALAALDEGYRGLPGFSSFIAVDGTRTAADVLGDLLALVEGTAPAVSTHRVLAA